MSKRRNTGDIVTVAQALIDAAHTAAISIDGYEQFLEPLAAASDALSDLIGSVPQEKPLPDAPGWWIVETGFGADARLVTVYDGHLPAWVDQLEPGRWYGPIALPWETHDSGGGT